MKVHIKLEKDQRIYQLKILLKTRKLRKSLSKIDEKNHQL